MSTLNMMALSATDSAQQYLRLLNKRELRSVDDIALVTQAMLKNG